jgi:hypothetical protein
VDTAGLGWAAAWGDCPPVSYLLRGCLHDRWVRFHSLPGSQRYASNDDEHAEIMRRHVTVLAELLEHGGADVIAATAGHKDQLRRYHQGWLSPHPSGL